jgi:ribosomal protein S18 acetylase RimI-like enzyme
MKNLLLSALFCLQVFNIHPEVTINNYDISHKDAVMEIVFQDPYNFFCGSDAVTRGFMQHEFFMAENKKGMEAVFADSFKIKKVLIKDGHVIGFIDFCKSREMSLESLKLMLEANGTPCNEDQLSLIMPTLKRTDAECREFILIECLAVSQKYRGNGFGRTLMRSAIQEIKTAWPELKQVCLNVNATNKVARKLYESEGFVVCPTQPSHLVMMNVIQYEKSLY